MSGFLGIDFDTREIHTVAIDEDDGRPLSFSSYDLAAGPGDSFQRARRVRDLLPARTRWIEDGTIAAGLEDVYSRHLSSVVGHKRVEGALLACLPREIPIYNLRPQTWKIDSLGAGHGNDDKDQIRAWAVELYPGLRFWPQGLIDAFAIATATRATYSRAAERRGRGAA